MENGNEKSSGVVVIEGAQAPVLAILPATNPLDNALATNPNAVTVKNPVATTDDNAKSQMSPGQLATLGEITANVYSTITEFQESRRVEGRQVHGVIIRALSQGLKLLESVDGRKAASAWVRQVFNPFIDVDKTPETHAYSTVQLFKSKTVVEAKAKTNPGYRQYFVRWIDLSLWETGIFKAANPKTGHPGENEPKLGVMVHGKTYMVPSAALDAENTLTDVHQAWKNIVRPSIEVIDHLPSKTATKLLFMAAAKQADEVSLIVREKRKVNGAERMQKVKKYAEELPEAALMGVISGLVGIACKRGMSVESIFTKVTAYANAAEDVETD